MPSIASDAESDNFTDEEYEPNNMRNIAVGDIVRFSTLSADVNSSGRVLSNGAVKK